MVFNTGIVRRLHQERATFHHVTDLSFFHHHLAGLEHVARVAKHAHDIFVFVIDDDVGIRAGA